MGEFKPYELHITIESFTLIQYLNTVLPKKLNDEINLFHNICFTFQIIFDAIQDFYVMMDQIQLYINQYKRYCQIHNNSSVYRKIFISNVFEKTKKI